MLRPRQPPSLAGSRAMEKGPRGTHWVQGPRHGAAQGFRGRWLAYGPHGCRKAGRVCRPTFPAVCLVLKVGSHHAFRCRSAVRSRHV